MSFSPWRSVAWGLLQGERLSGRTLENVVGHPPVLLSIVDHYNRVTGDTRKRVMGVLLATSSHDIVDVLASTSSHGVVVVLLGTSSRGSVNVTNSYATEDKVMLF